MSIIKLNNRSVKDITAFGSISSLGSLTHIATQTASSSASISFTSGIDSTYKEYIFFIVNIHPATNEPEFYVNFSSDSGSNYNVTKTTTAFRVLHREDDSLANVSYDTGRDLAQSTDELELAHDISSNSDSSVSGALHLFNPSSTTFVKHFLARTNSAQSHGGQHASIENFKGGYCNTTSVVNAVRFKFSSGNIDSGQILLFGLN